MRMTDLQVGWTVVGNDGRRLGTINGVGQEFLHVVRTGFAADLYVPVTSIANVERETVHLNITRDAAEQMGWEQAPRHDQPEAGSDDLHRHV